MRIEGEAKTEVWFTECPMSNMRMRIGIDVTNQVKYLPHTAGSFVARGGTFRENEKDLLPDTSKGIEQRDRSHQKHLHSQCPVQTLMKLVL